MAVFELFLDSESAVLPNPINIVTTIIDVGNKNYETNEEQYGKRVQVKCDIKPRDSAIFGIKWVGVK